MNQKTVNQLTKLNAVFYQNSATDFSNTRQSAWPGWEKSWKILSPHLAESGLETLDVGCGNGRWLNFLINKIPNQQISYTGLDFSSQLLAVAKSIKPPANFEVNFEKTDLMTDLINKDFETNNQFDLITAFAVFHHLPGKENRQKIFEKLAKKLKPNGFLILTTWNFMEDRKLASRIIKPSLVDIKANQLEKNDFVLDWKSGPTGYRYCHYFDQSEIDQLSSYPEVNFYADFQADGKSQKLNTYLIFQKKSKMQS